jgi:two-component system phosphate regulon response regulator PhoB
MPQRPVVLIADDETFILNVLDLKFTGGGYEVLRADDGEEALEIALIRSPDLVITDYQMPRLDGLSLARRLAAHPSTSQTPVLLLTARGARLTTAELVGTRVAQMISKPFSPREVLAQSDALLNAHRRPPREVAAT